MKGARIGVLRTLFGTGPDHQEVNRVMASALEVLKQQGAILVDVEDAAFDTGKLVTDLDVQKYEYKFVLNNYLKAQPNPPVHSLAELIATGNYHKPTLEKFLASAQSYEDGLNEADYKDRRSNSMTCGCGWRTPWRRTTWWRWRTRNTAGQPLSK